jgi:hypothetical protein
MNEAEKEIHQLVLNGKKPSNELLRKALHRVEAECHNNIKGYCRVSSLLAKQEVKAQQSVCQQCLLHDQPKSINPFTCKQALSAIKSIGGTVDIQLVKCANASGEGVGTELRKIFDKLSLLFKWVLLGRLLKVDPEGCGCGSLASAMNTSGIKACSANQKQHTKTIVTNYLKFTSKYFYPVAIALYPFMFIIVWSCISLAIKNATEATKHECSR